MRCARETSGLAGGEVEVDDGDGASENAFARAFCRLFCNGDG
jgi:hypothetical protein